MDSNAKTLATYSDHFANYIDGTVQVTSGFQARWLEFLLHHCKLDAPILEVGSAFGRDAVFITQCGYTQLIASDAFPEAVELLRQKGFRASKLNLLEDTIEGKYELIIASAVFLHFTQSELIEVLHKLRTSLTAGGWLGFSVKLGSGEEWTDAKMGAPRFFKYWREEELRTLLVETGYDIVDVRQTDDGKWMHMTCATGTLER